MAASPSAATAVALGETGSSDARAVQSGRKLTGRFLHITGGFVGFHWVAQ
jgi:endopolyphosphatase